MKNTLVNRLKRKTQPAWALLVTIAAITAGLAVASAGLAGTPPVKAKTPASNPVRGLIPIGNPIRGLSLYQSCTSCHSIDENEVGPKHRGIVGRRAATVPGYAYSAALTRSNIVWDEPSLDRWLASPQRVVPGSKMFFSVSNPQNRADIIAYLAQQH